MKQLDENQLQALLRLKRYENPPPGYFDGLLDRVHRRQREEMLSRPAWQIALERVRAFFAPLQMGWHHAGAMAAVLVVGILAIRVAIPDRTAAPVQVAESDAGSHIPASEPRFTLGPTTEQPLTPPQQRHITHVQGAPVRFIIDTQPPSYEATQISF